MTGVLVLLLWPCEADAGAFEVMARLVMPLFDEAESLIGGASVILCSQLRAWRLEKGQSHACLLSAETMHGCGGDNDDDDDDDGSMKFARLQYPK